MIAWAIGTLVASTLLMLVVLVLREPVRRAFGPSAAYALWLVPAARMVLPPLPGSIAGEAPAPLAAASATISRYAVLPLTAAPAAGEGGWGAAELLPLLLAAWVAGALGFIAWHAVSHARFCRGLLAGAARSRSLAEGRVRMIESEAVAGPMAFGVWRKYVAFPRDFGERYDPVERNLALAHELGHHARGDLAANWAALIVLGFHWFNPVAWRAFRAFRADQEMACDALVLAGRAEALRHAYGRAIVKSAHGGAVSAACHLHTVNEIKERLKMLKKHERVSRGRAWGGAAGVGALALAGLGLTASGTGAAEGVRHRVERTIGVELAELKLPKLPVSPLPVLAPAPVQAAQAPAAPEVPAEPERPAVPAAPQPAPAPVRAGDAAVVSEAVGPDGHRLVVAGARPHVRVLSRECGVATGEERRFTIEEGSGPNRTVTICTDRIADAAAAARARAEAARAQAETARADAMRARLAALEHARDGLRAARHAIERNPSLTDERRREALKGIDEAMAAMERERVDD